ncbi:MAG: OmpA family protein [Saprospiraceae bacterium]
MKISMVSAILMILVLSACVTTQDTTELNEQVDYYKDQALQADSIRTQYRNLQEEKRLVEADLNDMMKELERLRATNISLNRSYQEILSKFNAQVDQNQQVVATSSYDNLSLQQQLAEKQSILDTKERQLAQTEYDLRNKERTLNMMEYNYTEVKGSLSDKDRRIQELEAALAAKDQKLQKLRQSLDQALLGFSNDDLSVSEKNGKLYLSMSQNLLFSSGSEDIDWRGKKALMQVAEALKANTDFDVLVEGHTDSDGTASRNWDLSVLRATSVVKALTNYGVPPERITAAGRGFYVPIAQNNTDQGKALNRRTEIILSPKLDDLYQIIQN